MDMPKDRTNLWQWVDFFQATRWEILDRDGIDIAEERDTMFGWFAMIYMNGNDEARVERMFADAGVDNIEDYMRTLDRS